MGVILKSFGHYIPATSLTNAEISLRLGITEEYILEKTGIVERAYMVDGAVSDMIVNATLNCLAQTNISPNDIDCIIVATFTPGYFTPSTASVVHHKMGTGNA